MNYSLIVCNLRYEKLCDLVNNGDSSARRVQETLKLNQVTQLSFEIPLNNPHISYITNENLILFNNEYYRIKTPVINHNEDGASYLSVSCSHLSETLQTNVVTMKEITPKTVTELMKIALVYDGNIPTLGWKVGKVLVDTTKRRGLESAEQSAFSILCVIAEKFDGILKFNSQTKTVDMIPRSEVAKPDFELSVHKNLKSIEITYDTSEMVTRLYCFGGNDKNGNEINIISVNPTRMGYIENFDYFYGLGYTQEDIRNSPELFIKTNIWRDSNYYLPIDLYNDGIKELEKVAKPKIDIKVDALNLDQFPQYRMVPKNLKNIEITYDTSEMVTRLYCFGGNDKNGNEIDIISVNPTRMGYIENFDYFYGLGYTQEDIRNSPELFIKTNIWRDSNYYLPIDLYNDGIKELEKVAKPKIDIKVDALNLDQFPQYRMVPLELGDAINVRDEDIGISFLCNVIGRTIDYDEPHILNLELTNQIDYKNLLSELFKKVSTVGQVVTSGANINGSAIDGINTDQIRDINAKYASFEYLDANYIDVTDLAAQYAKIYDLDVVNADIDVLNTDLATVQTLVNGNLTSNNIQSLNLTSANTTIADAMIKDAMIESLSVDKVKSGEISTNKFNILSDSGNLVIADNTIQISDNTKVRVQIGKDDLGDYSMYIWDVNGNLMFDATGIHEDAIKSSIIRDDMVSPTANIGAEKLDISSLFEVINDDDTHTLKGSKIKLDAEGQTLDIIFNNITTKVDNITSSLKTFESTDGIYTIKIESLNGNTFENGHQNIVLKCTLFKDGENITNTLDPSCYKWTRKSIDVVSDDIWNSQNFTGYKITLNSSDLYKTSDFECEVTIPNNLVTFTGLDILDINDNNILVLTEKGD